MSFLNFVKSFFGDDPSQYVEPSDWEGFKNDVAVAAKRGVISKSEAQELMGSFKLSIGEKARRFAEKVESAIKLNPSDRLNAKAQEIQAVQVDAPKRTERTRDNDRIIGE
ncbi:MAG: hypothetical protein IKL55_02440 [Clostridia bacterium]|nr:hypothetical protein [Clostridia bacterium]